MRSCVVLLFASLLTLCEAQGTIVTPVFVLKGRDLLLKLQADPPEGVLFVDWKINKTVDLVRFKPSGEGTVLHSVTGGFEFPENKFSVILKNVQEVDSGVYSAVAVTPKGNKLLTKYNVTVEGPVSPVELIVDRVDSRSSESCDLHVTCSTHNSHISSTFGCDHQNCSEEGGEVTTSGASLQVYMLHKVIICNHRNQVHRTQDSIHAEHLCPQYADPLSHPGWGLATFVLVLVIVLGIIVYLCRKRLIDIIQRCLATMGGAALRLEKLLNEKSPPPENMSPAGAPGPSYSSVPSAAEPTDPQTGFELDLEKLLNEKSPPPENMSPAGAPGPSNSSVPSAAEPTDPQTGFELVEKIDN